MMKKEKMVFKKLGLIACIGLTSILGLSRIPAMAATINVPLDQATIQAAINAAEADDVVKVSAGGYLENITMKQGVDLIGSGPEYLSIAL